jgi:hypothetical protein
MEAKSIIAINKAISDKTVKAARNQLEEGRYEVDALVRVVGEVVVRADTSKAPTTSLLSVPFFLMVLRAAGVTRRAALSAIEKVAKEYLKDWEGDNVDKEMAKLQRETALKEYDPERRMAALFDSLKVSLPKVPVKGAVKFEGTVEQFEVASGAIDNALTGGESKALPSSEIVKAG